MLVLLNILNILHTRVTSSLCDNTSQKRRRAGCIVEVRALDVRMVCKHMHVPTRILRACPWYYPNVPPIVLLLVAVLPGAFELILS